MISVIAKKIALVMMKISVMRIVLAIKIVMKMTTNVSVAVAKVLMRI